MALSVRPEIMLALVVCVAATLSGMPTARASKGQHWRSADHEGHGKEKGFKVRAEGTAAERLRFSWDTVPVYQQLCNPNATLQQAFPKDRLAFLASKYPIITLEHCQGYYTFTQEGGNGSIEDYFKAAASDLKALNPNVTVLFYTNSVAGLSYYRWCAEAFSEHPAWRLTNDEGKLCPSGGGHMLPQYSGYLWDQTQPLVRDWWASLCLNLSNSSDSQLDGCSIDTAGTCLKSANETAKFAQARRQAVSLAQEKAGNDFIVGAVNARPEDKVQLSQIYTFGPDEKSLDWLNSMKQAGMIAQAHAQTAVGVKGDHVNASLATFLIGAYEKSYFAFSTNPGAGYHPFCDGTEPTWCYGMGWIGDFAKPLGAPLSDAVVTESGTHFERHFASGTNVTLDLTERSCDIRWADGSMTVCQKF